MFEQLKEDYVKVVAFKKWFRSSEFMLKLLCLSLTSRMRKAASFLRENEKFYKEICYYDERFIGFLIWLFYKRFKIRTKLDDVLSRIKKINQSQEL